MHIYRSGSLEILHWPTEEDATNELGLIFI